MGKGVEDLFFCSIASGEGEVDVSGEREEVKRLIRFGTHLATHSKCIFSVGRWEKIDLMH